MATKNETERMTDEQVNELLAMEVMGWKVGGYDGKKDLYYEEGQMPDLVMPVKDWQPTQNIKQALMCAEAYCDDNHGFISIDYHVENKQWHVNIWDGNTTKNGTGGDRKIECAICLALVEAVGE